MNMLKEKFGFKKKEYSFNKMIMKKIFLGFLIFSQIYVPIFGETKFKTKNEADNFLSKYCIDLISFTKEVVKNQKIAAEEKDWKEFYELGGLIQGASQIYSNFCK